MGFKAKFKATYFSRKFHKKVLRVFQESFNEFLFCNFLHESHRSYPSKRRACLWSYRHIWVQLHIWDFLNFRLIWTSPPFARVAAMRFMQRNWKWNFLEHTLDTFFKHLKLPQPLIFLEIPFKLHWSILKSFLGHPLNFLEIPLRLPWNYFELLLNTLETNWNLPWNTLQFSSKHPWTYLEIPFKLSWNSLESSLKLLWNFVKHHWNFPDTPFKFP